FFLFFTLLVWHSRRGPRHAMLLRVLRWRCPRLCIFGLFRDLSRRLYFTWDRSPRGPRHAMLSRVLGWRCPRLRTMMLLFPNRRCLVMSLCLRLGFLLNNITWHRSLRLRTLLFLCDVSRRRLCLFNCSWDFSRLGLSPFNFCWDLKRRGPR